MICRGFFHDPIGQRDLCACLCLCVWMACAVVGCIFVILSTLGLLTDESVSVSSKFHSVMCNHGEAYAVRKSETQNRPEKNEPKNELNDLIYSLW